MGAPSSYLGDEVWLIKNIVNRHTELNAKKIDIDPNRVPLVGRYLGRGGVLSLPDSVVAANRRFIDLLVKGRILKITKVPDV